MVKLEPIQQKDFEIFLESGIREYAEDHVRNGNWTAEEALERSKKEFEQLLPDGINSQHQYLYSIINEDNNKIGVLWVPNKGSEGLYLRFHH